MAERKGHYHDAIFVKGNRVLCAIFELSGAACPEYAAHMRRRAREAKEGRDGTIYGKSRLSAQSFYAHYLQRCARAVTLEHARHMIANISELKAKAYRKTAGAGQ